MAAKLLVIDDDDLLFRTFSRLLRKQGYDTYLARCGDTALELAVENQVDLILSDIKMPGRNGLETVEAILETYETAGWQRPAVIFMSGYLDLSLAGETQKIAPGPIIWKPFDTLEILMRIREELEMRKKPSVNEGEKEWLRNSKKQDFR